MAQVSPAQVSPVQVSPELIASVGRRMIQRRDVKARQSPDGGYYPVRDRASQQNIPFKLVDLQNHFLGTETYGHYLLDQDSNCKFFAFDLDLEKTGFWVDTSDPWNEEFHTYEYNPRGAWQDRGHPSRPWLKQQMRTLAGLFASAINQTLSIPCAAAYTGNKGIHVYGFTGTIPAVEAREGARLVLDAMGTWEPSRGKVFYTHTDRDPFSGYPNFSLEVFPKQDTVDSQSLGNLMRLPLGKNLKSPKDPTFFIDLTTELTVLRPHADPVSLLETGNAWL